MDLCWQSDVYAFEYTVSVYHSFPSKKQVSSNFMAAVPICSDFEAFEEEICHYFHFSPNTCHEVMGPDAMIVFVLMLNFKPAFFTLLFHLHQEVL